MRTQMTGLTCYKCFVAYSIPKAMWEKSQRRESGHGWYCPNGHWSVASIGKEYDELKQSNAALRGVITKLKRRLKK